MNMNGREKKGVPIVHGHAAVRTEAASDEAFAEAFDKLSDETLAVRKQAAAQIRWTLSNQAAADAARLKLARNDSDVKTLVSVATQAIGETDGDDDPDYLVDLIASVTLALLALYDDEIGDFDPAIFAAHASGEHVPKVLESFASPAVLTAVAESWSSALFEFVAFNRYKVEVDRAVAVALDSLTLLCRIAPGDFSDACGRVLVEIEPEADAEATMASYLVFAAFAVVDRQAAELSLVKMVVRALQDERVPVVTAALRALTILRERFRILTGDELLDRACARHPVAHADRKEFYDLVREVRSGETSEDITIDFSKAREIPIKVTVEGFSHSVLLSLLRSFIGGAVPAYVKGSTCATSLIGLERVFPPPPHSTWSFDSRAFQRLRDDRQRQRHVQRDRARASKSGATTAATE